MPTSIDKYLDPVGLNETVLNIRQITEGLEAEMQDLPYARPDGLYPDMTVGAVIGADETAQWATRESSSTGTAIVRSVQGAAETIDGVLVPVRIAGIASTTAQGGELDSIEWTAQTLWGTPKYGDELTVNLVTTNVAKTTITSAKLSTVDRNSQGHTRLIFYNALPQRAISLPVADINKGNSVVSVSGLRENGGAYNYGAIGDYSYNATSFFLILDESTITTVDEAKNWLDAHQPFELVYPLETPHHAAHQPRATHEVQSAGRR